MKNVWLVLIFIFAAGFGLSNAQTAGGPEKKDAPPAVPANAEEIALVKNIFKKIEDATAREDINAYLSVFSKRLEIETEENVKLSYDDLKQYLIDLFDAFDEIKDEPVKDYEIKITENTADVVNNYRLSGIPKGEDQRVVIDEGTLRIVLTKLPSFSPKMPAMYQVVKVSYLKSAETVSADDKKTLTEIIKENYGIDIETSGGLDLYRSALLQDLKAENDSIKEDLESRLGILEKRLKKTFSAVLKKTIQEDINEIRRNLAEVPTDDEVASVVDNEIAELKEIFQKKD